MPGTVSVVCLANDGTPIRDARVLLNGARRYGGTSGDGGRALIRNVEPGSYRLVVRLIGYREESRRVEVQSGSSSDMRVTLDPLTTELATVTVTASRAARQTNDLPVSVDVIPSSELSSRKGLYLSDVLSERTGINVISDHGSSVQMQGMDANYTLVLVNGEPLIGRVAGTLDLNRLTLENVEKVEIIKGPTSSLYGSDALAGVINVITRTPDTAFGGSLSGRYGTNGTADGVLDAHLSRAGWSGAFHAQRLSSNGYDLTPESISPTVAPYVTYIFQPQLEYRFSPHASYSISGGFSQSTQKSQEDIVDEHLDTVRAEDRSMRREWNLNNILRQTLSDGITATAKLYWTRFLTESAVQQERGEIDRTNYDQSYLKGEGQIDLAMGGSDMLIGGAGYVHESVAADYILGGERTLGSYFLYAQNEWIPSSLLNVTSGMRFDSHQDYGTNFSPKLAVLFRPLEWIGVRASVGTGFKSPTFQELYLDFTNPSVGYSVFGATDVLEGIARLQGRGEIETMLRTVDHEEELRPEHSTGINAGIDLHPIDRLTLQANFFLNDIKDLIDATPIATKTNGQQVYTYFNLNSVVTRGMEAEIRTELVDSFSISFGYSYLDAYDVQVLDQIRRGEISKVGSTGRIRPVQEEEYGGLFNRSRHSGTFRLAYNNAGIGLNASLRGILRGRYGYADVNMNGVLDADSEYAPGYALWNISASQALPANLTLFVTVENLLDKRDTRLPSLPGRLVNAGFNWTYR